MSAPGKKEKILISLDGIEKIPAPGFFYTRVAARMKRESGVQGKPVLILRPAFLSTCLLVALIINVAALLNKENKPAASVEATPAAENFAKEYNLLSTGQLYE